MPDVTFAGAVPENDFGSAVPDNEFGSAVPERFCAESALYGSFGLVFKVSSFGLVFTPADAWTLGDGFAGALSDLREAPRSPSASIRGG